MTRSASSRELRWDVFCYVVDNYGDAAVCWRLARELAARSRSAGREGNDGRVRLWIDDLRALQALCPEVDAQALRQRVAGVEVLLWQREQPFDMDAAGAPAEVAIDAFGCGLPDAYAGAMAVRQPAALWITLEYLSAESWVASHHGLPSPPPRLAVQRYFFFPGFTPDTGGLIKEADLDIRRRAFQSDQKVRDAFWRARGFSPVAKDAFTVSLFGYENPGVAALLGAWGNGQTPVVAALPPGRLRPQVLAYFGVLDAGDGAAIGTVLRQGNLEVRLLPFLAQSHYDELLWSCDCNFVRGEDSFVRAQWAARPLVWHIYAQAEDVHWAKLDAFLERWCTGLAPDVAVAVRNFWHAWNGRGDCRAAWEAMMVHRQVLAGHAGKWPKALDLAGNLAEKLAQFCADRLKSPAS